MISYHHTIKIRIRETPLRHHHHHRLRHGKSFLRDLFDEKSRESKALSQVLENILRGLLKWSLRPSSYYARQLHPLSKPYVHFILCQRKMDGGPSARGGDRDGDRSDRR